MNLKQKGEENMAETIAAIATALSASGIGIIRISGPESREIAGRIYRSKGGKKISVKCRPIL